MTLSPHWTQLGAYKRYIDLRFWVDAANLALANIGLHLIPKDF